MVYWLCHSRPRVPREVTSLFEDEVDTILPEDRILERLNEGYDDPASKVVVPSVYRNLATWFTYYNIVERRDFPISPESRIQAWQGILDAGENHPENVDRRLLDAWDTSKRSREYLNAQMDKYDLDNIYYSEAYRVE